MSTYGTPMFTSLTIHLTPVILSLSLPYAAEILKAGTIIGVQRPDLKHLNIVTNVMEKSYCA